MQQSIQTANEGNAVVDREREGGNRDQEKQGRSSKEPLYLGAEDADKVDGGEEEGDGHGLQAEGGPGVAVPLILNLEGVVLLHRGEEVVHLQRKNGGGKGPDCEPREE